VVGPPGHLRKERQASGGGAIVVTRPPQRSRLGCGLIGLGQVIDEVEGLRKGLEKHRVRVRREAVGEAKGALEVRDGLAVRARGKGSMPGR
jgi:hypothetical protein